MSAHVVQLRFRGIDALVRSAPRGDSAAWHAAIARAVAGADALASLCAAQFGTPPAAPMQDDGERRVFVVEGLTPKALAAARAAVEREALTMFEGRLVPILSAIEADASADAHATLAALEHADARAAVTPFATQLRATDVCGPFALVPDAAVSAAADAPWSARDPVAIVAFAIDPLRPAPAGSSGACPFLTWLLLQETGHDLLAGVAEHQTDRAVTPLLAWGGKALFATSLRDALAFVDAVAADARERWQISISCAMTFALRGADVAAAGARAWGSLCDAHDRAERGSLVVDDVRMQLASIARQRELATGLETLARRAPGPVRELARAAATFARKDAKLDVGELARLRGAIHALAAKSGVNARNARRGFDGDPAAAALAALVAESARGFESGEAILPLSYAVWMTSIESTEAAR